MVKKILATILAAILAAFFVYMVVVPKFVAFFTTHWILAAFLGIVVVALFLIALTAVFLAFTNDHPIFLIFLAVAIPVFPIASLFSGWVEGLRTAILAGIGFTLYVRIFDS